MFYTLGNILSPKARHAEGTDTRQEIRRQDPDEQRRSNQDHEDEPELFSSEDDTIVSIIDLRAFLENFLKSLPSEKTDEEKAESKQKEMAEDALKIGHDFNKKRPITGNMVHAMGAYQSAAKSGAETKRLSTDDTKRAAENLGLEASEVRTIHTLIEDLKVLSDRNIDDLTIERSTSFLQSLVNAVAKTKVQN